MAPGFAALTLPEFTGFLVIVVGMLGGFYTLIKSMQTQATKDREADREERKEFSDAIKQMAVSSEKVAETNQQIATSVDKQSAESAERNGHLGELIVEQGKQTQKIADIAVTKIVDSVQHVATQEVNNQHIKNTVKDQE